MKTRRVEEQFWQSPRPWQASARAQNVQLWEDPLVVGGKPYFWHTTVQAETYSRTSATMVESPQDWCLSTVGRRVLGCSAPQLWNSPPTEIWEHQFPPSLDIVPQNPPFYDSFLSITSLCCFDPAPVSCFILFLWFVWVVSLSPRKALKTNILFLFIYLSCQH